MQASVTVTARALSHKGKMALSIILAGISLPGNMQGSSGRPGHDSFVYHDTCRDLVLKDCQKSRLLFSPRQIDRHHIHNIKMAIDNAQDDDDDDSLTFASLLPKLTLEEKVKLISGYRFNAAPGILRLHVGVPPIKVSQQLQPPRNDKTSEAVPCHRVGRRLHQRHPTIRPFK